MYRISSNPIKLFYMLLTVMNHLQIYLYDKNYKQAEQALSVALSHDFKVVGSNIQGCITFSEFCINKIAS